jgi:hypothetical protein
VRKANSELPKTNEEHVNRALMDKAAWKAHLKKDRKDKIKRKRLAREKYEKDHCGGYQLIYPFVSYAEEDMINARIEKEEKAMGKDRPSSADSNG